MEVGRLADSGFFKNFMCQGGVKSTVFWVFEDLKFKTKANMAEPGKLQFLSYLAF